MPVFKVSKSLFHLSAIATCALMTTNLFADTVLVEEEFNNYSFGPPIHSSIPAPGSTHNVTSTPIFLGDGNVMLQEFNILMNSNVTISTSQPIFPAAFKYNPQTEGAISNLTASLITIPAFAIGQLKGFAQARIFALQDNQLYFHNIDTYATDDDTTLRVSSPLTQNDFIGIGPNVIIPNAHPDFSGNEIFFGVGIDIAPIGYDPNKLESLMVFFDDPTIRISARPIPEPASILLLGAPALIFLKRKRKFQRATFQIT
ncbi:PEP-CTERM sorting domain-containing protein [Planctomycetota bacterium]|nr:PEP-CTERM sorting domain-containing protein [Planctomycetota bacterium]